MFRRILPLTQPANVITFTRTTVPTIARLFSHSLPAMSTQMRAVKIKGETGPASSLYIGEVDKPQPKEGQILVKVNAFGLNRMDLLQREGKYPLPPQAGPILGVEFSGVVQEDGVGENAKRWKKGDEVFGLTYGGAYAEYVTVSGLMVIRKPPHLTHVECAAIPENFLTAFQALFLVGNFKAGENALIHAGAGGVGVAANQLARAFGAKEVFTTAGSAEKLKFLADLPKGPTHGINYREEKFDEVILSKTNKYGVDVILDFIGKDYWHMNINSLAPSGRLVLLGFMSGTKVPDMDLGKLLFKRLRIEGTTLRARDEAYQGNLLKRFETEALSKIDSGEIKICVHDVLSWDRVIEAHEMMEANKNSGKIILEIPEKA